MARHRRAPPRFPRTLRLRPAAHRLRPRAYRREDGVENLRRDPGGPLIREVTSVVRTGSDAVDDRRTRRPRAHHLRKVDEIRRAAMRTRVAPQEDVEVIPGAILLRRRWWKIGARR